MKNATRKNPIIKEALESVDRNFGAWLERFPFKRGDSPLAASPEYENFIFDQQTDIEYGPYWKQIGLNVEEYVDEFVDIPCMWMSGWYDICQNATPHSQTQTQPTFQAVSTPATGARLLTDRSHCVLFSFLDSPSSSSVPHAQMLGRRSISSRTS